MVSRCVEMPFPDHELEQGGEAFLEAGLEGVVTVDATADSPHPVVHVGTGDEEFDHGGCRVEGSWFPSGLQRGGQADGFERGAGLSAVTNGQVDLGVLVVGEEVPAAHHDQHVAILRVHHHHGGVGVALVGRKMVLDRLLSGRLEV